MHHVISIEASHQRGMGHLYRGLNLARAMRQAGTVPVVVINDDETSIRILQQEGLAYETADYFDNADWEGPIIAKYKPIWWINDRLDTSSVHAAKVKQTGTRLATFDDHGDGAQFAEYNFLAMDLFASIRASNCRYGPDYIILNPEIDQYRNARRKFNKPSTVLITLGGSDTYGVTPRVLSAVVSVFGEFNIEVVIGPHFRHIDVLNKIAGKMDGSLNIFNNVPSLLTMMAKSDIVICGGGVTLYEAAAIGIPAITIANEPHEISVVEWFASNGFSLNAGFHREAFEPGVARGLVELLQDENSLSARSEKGKSLVDGKGLMRILKLLGGADV